MIDLILVMADHFLSLVNKGFIVQTVAYPRIILVSTRKCKKPENTIRTCSVCFNENELTVSGFHNYPYLLDVNYSDPELFDLVMCHINKMNSI